MSTQPFTRNHRDHSNDMGFQFEFFCDKCGNGHRSSFDTSGVGVAASVIKAAGAFFGGGLSRAGWGADHVKDAFRGPAWDGAFKKAIEECKPSFRQCTRCGIWVCPEVCWNQARGLCENCAPDLGEQAAAIQAQVAVEQTWEKARAVDRNAADNFRAARVSVRSAASRPLRAQRKRAQRVFGPRPAYVRDALARNESIQVVSGRTRPPFEASPAEREGSTFRRASSV
jgi:hypothetical protein